MPYYLDLGCQDVLLFGDCAAGNIYEYITQDSAGPGMSTLRNLSFKRDHEGGFSEMCEGLAEEVDLHRCLIACHL